LKEEYIRTLLAFKNEALSMLRLYSNICKQFFVKRETESMNHQNVYGEDEYASKNNL